MKYPVVMRALFVICVYFMVSATASAHGRYYRSHHHSRIGIGFYLGPRFGYPWYYGYPYYDPFWYPPTRVIAVPIAPPIYIEQETSTGPARYWYYCRNPAGYYPAVQQCPGGWLAVPPR